MNRSTFRDHLRAALLVSALTIGVAGIAPVAHASSADQAVAYQQDPGHAGSSAAVSFATAPDQHWTRSFSGGVSYPLIVNGIVYVTVGGSSSTSIYALDQATGATLWSGSVGSGYPWSGLAYDRGRVFTISSGGLLTAFDAPTGAIDWVVQMKGQSSFSSPPTASGGIVYLGGAGSGGTLYATAEDTGDPAWSASVENGDHSSPAVSGGRVFVTYPGQSYAFDALTGTLDWHLAGGVEGGGGRTPAVADGHLYVRDPITSSVIASPAAGTLQGALGSATIPAVGGGSAYEMAGHVLSAVAGDGLGSSPWSFTGDGTLDSAPLITSDAVIAGGSSGNLYARDPATGNALWSVAVGSAIPAPDEQNASQPLTGLGAANGTLVVPAGTSVVAYSRAPAAAVPQSVLAPSVDGAAYTTRQMAADVGTWSDDPNAYAYRWQRCDAAGATCADIAGATGANFVPGASDLGKTLRVGVTASNATGASSEVFSAASAVVTAPPPPPAPPVPAPTTPTTPTTPTPPRPPITPTPPHVPTATVPVPTTPHAPAKPKAPVHKPAPVTHPVARVPGMPAVSLPKRFHLLTVERGGMPVTVHCFAACAIHVKINSYTPAGKAWGTMKRSLRKAGRSTLKVHLRVKPVVGSQMLITVSISEHGRPGWTTQRFLYRITPIR